MSTEPSSEESPLVVTPDDGMTGAVAVAPAEPEPIPAATPVVRVDPVARRRADVDSKQRAVARALADLGCEAAVLLNPAHVAWFTSGMNVRGLLADTERPGVYTNGKQRFLICSNVDTFRLFDEELDGLGFQLKEWQWLNGRAGLLGELMAHKKIAVDRPYPNMVSISERLRPELRRLSAFDRERYLKLGKQLAHALEATARSCQKGETEGEIAGHLAHRLVRRGAELTSVTVTTDARGRKFRRAGANAHPVAGWCTIQAT
ncbi:MAG: hypothetical protein ACRC7O_03005, partial [Fimbriiglobus sp.]